MNKQNLKTKPELLEKSKKIKICEFLLRNNSDIEPTIRSVVGKLKYTDQLIKLVGVKESGIRAALDVAEDA